MSFIAIYVAMFAVFEYLGSVLGFFRMPNGGSFSISEIPLVIGIYHLGFKKGLLIVFLNFIVMFMLKPPYVIHWFQFLLDYIFAYGSYLIVAVLSGKKFNVVQWISVLLLASVLRYTFHNISGMMYFGENFEGNILLGVSIYNLTYMLPSVIILLILTTLLVPRINKLLERLG